MEKIKLTAPESPDVDVMQGYDRWHSKVGEHGFVALVDCMPRLVPQGQTADFAIVQAARTSFGDGTKTPSDDRSLIRYLMRHRHTTPLEMCEIKTHMAMPIFVARQFIRHRTANVNEYSARYSVVKDRFYLPAAEEIRAQSKTNKQASDGGADQITAGVFSTRLEEASRLAYEDYQAALNAGIGRELARMILPVNAFTEWYWKIDLHNLLHFLALRMDPHAQKEIRDYANALYELIRPIFPITCEAFEDYHPLRGAMLLTRLEIEALAGGESIRTENKREREEFQGKLCRLKIWHHPNSASLVTTDSPSNTQPA